MSGSSKLGCCCPEDEEQACCLPDDEGCVLLLPADCRALGGTVPGQATCVPDPCVAVCPDDCTDCPGTFHITITGLHLFFAGVNWIYLVDGVQANNPPDCNWDFPQPIVTVNGIPFPVARPRTLQLVCIGAVTEWTVNLLLGEAIVNEPPGLIARYSLPVLSGEVCPATGVYPNTSLQTDAVVIDPGVCTVL